MTIGLISTVILTGVILLMPSAFALDQNGIIEMPYSDKTPTIDGKFTSADEWTDASQTSIKNNENLAYLLVKHDRDNIYLLLDYVTDQTDADSDYIATCFDTENNGNSHDPGDFCFGSILFPNKKSPFVTTWGGDGKPNSEYNRLAARWQFSLSSTNDPFESGRDHMIYEISIPISFLHRHDSYGFYVEADDKLNVNSIVWPRSSPTTIADSPASTWGSLVAPEKTVTLQLAPVISIDSKSLVFDNQEITQKSSTRTVTVSNIGTSVLKISAITVPDEFSVSGIKTPLEIQPNQSISFNVVFAPIILGEKSGNIVISSNDLSHPSVTIDVSGTAIEKGKSPLGGGCLIATATFGSELAPQVQQLRETRDNVLLQTQSGNAFMTAFNQFYYTFSPTVADWERENPIFKEAVKITITPLITTLSILNLAPIHSDAEMIFYGIGIILLNIGMYFVAPAVVILRIKQYKK